MKVAYIATEFPALTEAFVVTECQAVADRGVEVLPFTFREPKFATLRTPAQHEWATRTLRPNPLAIAAFLMRPRARIKAAMEALHDQPIKTRAALPWCAQVAEICEREHVTHIHAHFARGAATLAWVVSSLSGIPFSFTAHAFGVHLSQPDALARRCQAAAFVRATTRHVAESLTGRVHVIGTPVDTDALTYRDPVPIRSPVVVLSVARDVPKKGLDLLRRLTLPRPFELRLFGPGTEGGPIDNDRVHAEMRRADVFVLPCRVDANGDRDGLPVVLLEAFALGLPCVSTRVAGIPELFTGALSAHLAEPDDLDDLTRTVMAALAEPRRTAHMQRDVVTARFSPDVVQALCELWQKNDTLLGP